MNPFVSSNTRALTSLGNKMAEMLNLPNVGTEKHPEYMFYKDGLAHQCDPATLCRMMHDNFNHDLPKEPKKHSYHVVVSARREFVSETQINLGDRSWDDVGHVSVKTEEGVPPKLELIFDDGSVTSLPINPFTEDKDYGTDPYFLEVHDLQRDVSVDTYSL